MGFYLSEKAKGNSMKKCEPKSGVTLVEVLVVVVIMGILAATVPSAITKYAADKRAEMSVADFWMEMNALRSKALKGGSAAIVLFDTTTSRYTTHLDANQNDTADTNEVIRTNEPLTLHLGLPTPTPSVAAPGATDLNKISTSWKTGFRVRLNSTLSIPSGYLYLKNSARPTTGYCLTVPRGETEVQLFKWDGTKWYKF